MGWPIVLRLFARVLWRSWCLGGCISAGGRSVSLSPGGWLCGLFLPAGYSCFGFLSFPEVLGLLVVIFEFLFSAFVFEVWVLCGDGVEGVFSDCLECVFSFVFVFFGV